MPVACALWAHTLARSTVCQAAQLRARRAGTASCVGHGDAAGDSCAVRPAATAIEFVTVKSLDHHIVKIHLKKTLGRRRNGRRVVADPARQLSLDFDVDNVPLTDTYNSE